MRVVDGFQVQLAAAEPWIEEPVALSFDADGRLYVAELRSFMLNIDGHDGERPMSRISRLEDTDNDGRFDRVTRFLEELVVPRSVAAVRDGLPVRC